jgi:hypothetical protein
MKKMQKSLIYLLVFTMLVGFAVPFAGASEPVEIVFVNPLAEIEPIDNTPVASRVPIREKLEAGEPVQLLVMYYAKQKNVEITTAMADLVREQMWNIFRENYIANGITEMTEAIVVTLAAGGTTVSVTSGAGGHETSAMSPDHWRNQGPINPETGFPESRIPTHGTPWGPKTGFGYTGFPAYEQNFERYAQWASADAVIYGVND